MGRQEHPPKEREGIAHLSAPLLPTAWYADARHPLNEGYARLAEEILACPGYQALGAP